MPYDREELFNLPVEEKYRLVMDLWDNIDENHLTKAMTRNGFEDEIDGRIQKIEENPNILIPWEDVAKKMKD